MSEALVDVFVDRREEDDNEGCADSLIEAGLQLADRYLLVAAQTLVDVYRRAKFACSIRVLLITQNCAIGTADRVSEVVSVLVDKENENVDNLCKVRVCVDKPDKDEFYN